MLCDAVAPKAMYSFYFSVCRGLVAVKRHSVKSYKPSNSLSDTLQPKLGLGHSDVQYSKDALCTICNQTTLYQALHADLIHRYVPPTSKVLKKGHKGIRWPKQVKKFAG